jgi:outer membrane protein OmpA-like peptidoglycan-associated protein
MRRAIIAILALLLVPSCAPPPKPQELLGIEALRKGERFDQAKKDQQALSAESEQEYKKAVEAWQDKDLDEAKHWATLATIKLQTALDLVEQELTRERLAADRKQLLTVQSERATVEGALAETKEKIKLVEELGKARKAAAQLTEEQQIAAAEQKISKAQLALKMADTVEASKYAPEAYSLAQAMLDKASAALKVKNPMDASAAAEVAQTRADAAYATARPMYLQARATATRQAQNQALQKDAAAIGSLQVKLEASGETQRLVLPIYSLFKRSKATPVPDKVVVLNSIGALLKKYPGYPVLINGYTSHLVGARQRQAISLARAQQVANHFVSLGLPLNRFAVSGLGGENLFARKMSPINDRVEVVLLFQ